MTTTSQDTPSTTTPTKLSIVDPSKSHLYGNPQNRGHIHSINLSQTRGGPKMPIPQHASVEVSMRGIVGDAHSGYWHRQVSLLGLADISAFSAQHQNRQILPGEFAENLTVRDLNFDLLRPLDILQFTDSELLLQVSQLGKKCHGSNCSIFREMGECVMPKRGVFARVVHPGDITHESEIIHHPYEYKFHVITMSDSAAAGLYSDESGPRVRHHLDLFMNEKQRKPKFSDQVLPDDREYLLRALQDAVNRKVDAIFITGGTGIGPRDITPEVVSSFADKTIPGIMEYIRSLFASKIPASQLSRSMAAVRSLTMIYAIPGSPRAVDDYMPHLLNSFEHSLYMLHGIGH